MQYTASLLLHVALHPELAAAEMYIRITSEKHYLKCTNRSTLLGFKGYTLLNEMPEFIST